MIANLDDYPPEDDGPERPDPMMERKTELERIIVCRCCGERFMRGRYDDPHVCPRCVGEALAEQCKPFAAAARKILL